MNFRHFSRWPQTVLYRSPTARIGDITDLVLERCEFLTGHYFRPGDPTNPLQTSLQRRSPPTKLPQFLTDGLGSGARGKHEPLSISDSSSQYLEAQFIKARMGATLNRKAWDEPLLTADPTVTHWIAGLKSGDADAAQRLWDRYFKRLVSLARNHLGVYSHAGADGEDVAQSVFKSLCLGAERGKFPQLSDRDSLWMLLVAMSTHKSRDLLRHNGRLKRGGGRVLDEAALLAGDESISVIEEIVRCEPTPEFAAEIAEECQRLLSRLNDVERRTAQLKLQDLTNQEVAAEMGCGLRTVERRLRAVRRVAATLP